MHTTETHLEGRDLDHQLQYPGEEVSPSSAGSEYLTKQGRSIKLGNIDEDWECVRPFCNDAIEQLKRDGYTSKDIEIAWDNFEREGTVQTIWLDNRVAWQATANRTAFNATEYVVTSFLPNGNSSASK